MKRVLLLLGLAFCYLFGYSQETSVDQLRSENFKKLRSGMTSEEIISLLMFKKEINKAFNGGIFIGIGLLQDDTTSDNKYTGVVTLHEYKIILEKCKLKDWRVDSVKVGSTTFSGEYIYEGIIGDTKNTWSLNNGHFDIKTVAIPNEPGGRIYLQAVKSYESDVEEGNKKIDFLVKEGYKIINQNGYDSFLVYITTFAQITDKLGINYLLDDYMGEDGKTFKGIFYPELGVGFYSKRLNKLEKILFMRFLSPFKGILIFDNKSSYMYDVYKVELNKTTLGEFDGRKFEWRSNYRGKNYYGQFKPHLELVLTLEKNAGFDDSKPYIINEIQLF